MMPGGVTLAGFLGFIRTVMGIGTVYLPDNSPVIPVALGVALNVVNPVLLVAPSVACLNLPGVPTTYALAVYNLAGNNLVNFAQDQAGQTYFKDLRSEMELNAFVGGVINSSGDQGTSESMVVPKQFEGLTIANLQTLKTPWGRTYLGIAQSVGNEFGMS